MTTDQTRKSHRRVTLALFLSTLFVTACSGSSDGFGEASPTTFPQPAIEADASGPTSTDTTTSEVEAPPVATAPRPEPQVALASAIEALGETYDFQSEVTTPAGDTVVVSGSRNGGASQFRITAGIAALDAISIDQNLWLRQDGSDEWIATTEAVRGDPLQGLATPLEVQWGVDGEATMDATYTAASLGLDTTDNVAVQITVVGDTMRFESVTGPNRLVTTLQPTASPAAIQPPTT